MIEELLTPYICERFQKEDHYRNGHIRIINPLPGEKILGLHIPDMRKIATNLVKEGKSASIIQGFKKMQDTDSRRALSYEEKVIWGMMLNRMRLNLEERLEEFRDFIPTIDNWAICDTICSDAKWCKKHLSETWDFLMPYFSSNQEFEVRFALVMSLAHFLTEDHIDSVFEQIRTLKYSDIVSEYEYSKTPTPYYVNMAVAWLLATALYKFPEKTRAFINSGSVPDHIVKLYIRKAKESFRTRAMNPQ